jgi:hypothetical protein
MVNRLGMRVRQRSIPVRCFRSTTTIIMSREYLSPILLRSRALGLASFTFT